MEKNPIESQGGLGSTVQIDESLFVRRKVSTLSAEKFITHDMPL